MATLSQARVSATVARRSTATQSAGFTLLEMIIVLVLIAILASLAMPAVQSAFREQGIRKDTHQLALMVKTAMIQSAEQHRTYVIDLSSSEISLHPAGEAAADPDASATTDDTPTASDDDSADKPVIKDVIVTTELDPENKLQMPDPQKPDTWIAMPPTSWIFESGELCPATPVRISRGEAYVGLTFDALTGNVADETYYLP